ncbi:hypothetical protein Mapa_015057 [Marchantia paleacea]|nr:hypothetical protein Mapa_015057 [Marchantia paleacea]
MATRSCFSASLPSYLLNSSALISPTSLPMLSADDRNPGQMRAPFQLGINERSSKTTFPSRQHRLASSASNI